MPDPTGAPARYRVIEPFGAGGAEAFAAQPRRHAELAPGAARANVALALIGGRRLAREATAQLLAAQPELEVVGSYESAGEFFAGEAPEATDVVLVDYEMRDRQLGRRTVAALAGRTRRYKVVVLTDEISEKIVAFALGVDGLALKRSRSRELCATLACVAEGHTVIPAGWQQMLAGEAEDADLSDRHREVLALIAEGCGNQEIAVRLGLSPNTVKFHVRNLYARLGVSNRVQAANVHVRVADGAA